MRPSQCSRKLRALADGILHSATSSAARTAASLGRIAEAIEKGEADQVVVLRGPFKPSGVEGDPGVYEGQVSGLVIKNDEFNAHVLKEMGVTSPEEMAEYRDDPPDEHTFHVEVDFHWETPDPSVGWAGGGSVDGWELLALDGLELTAEDVQAVRPYIEKAVSGYEEKWVDSEAESKADDYDPPDPYDDYYDR